MLDYVAIYPETLAMVKRYPASDRALLYEAMVFYGVDGSEPDWPEDDLKWLVWESLRQRVDAASKKSETNRRNRQQRNGTNDNETERTATNNNEPQRNETNANPDTETETELDTESDQTPGMETHTQIQQHDTAPARVKPGWFNPATPQAPDDGAWRYSEQARKAIAQRILAYVINNQLLKEQFTVTEAGTIGEDLFEALCAAMKEGLTPREVMQMVDDCRKTWQLERDLKEWVVSQGGAADHPEWREQVEELSQPLFDYG